MCLVVSSLRLLFTFHVFSFKWFLISILIWNGFVEHQNRKNLWSGLATEHAKLGLVKNCLNSIMHWLANMTILLFTRTFETWYFCFSRTAKGILHDPFVFWYLNPLTPVPPVTARVETHPQFPVLPVTAREKACEDNCLSYPPWRDFGPPIVLSLLRTKPMRMDFLSIFLEDFRGPRKTVFCLQITRSKTAGNRGTLPAKSTNFQSLVFIP